MQYSFFLLKQIHAFTSNILFEIRSFGLGCFRFYQVKGVVGTKGVLMVMMIGILFILGHKNDSEHKQTRGDKIA